MKTTSRILLFFYDDFEDLLAPITFAKNFVFLAGVDSKIFAIKNATNRNITIEIITKISIFTKCMIGKSYLLPYVTLTFDITSRTKT